MPDISNPASIQSNWEVVCSALGTAESGAAVDEIGEDTLVVNPNAIARTGQQWTRMAVNGTLLEICLRYHTADPPTEEPVVQVFGRDGNRIPQQLVDAEGNHVLTMPLDDADVQDGTYSYGTALEFDMRGNTEFIVAIQTEASGGTGLAILARAK